VRRHGFWFAGTALAALAVSVSAPAAAQSNDQVAQSDGELPSEIVVTAQRRSERLLDVPVAVTALLGETLANQQVRGIDTLQQLVPSLTFTQSTNDLNNNVRVRGVGTALFNVGLESSVSFVVDGVVLSRQGQGFQDLIDIERIEVLRGPQGVLFGKNATAGVINVVTKRPPDTLTFEGEGVIAEQDEYRLRGSVSGPLGDSAGFRVTGFWNDVGGHIRNIATGNDYNGGESYGVRGKLEFEPSETLNLLLIADYRKSEADCCQFQARSFANPVALAQLAPIVPSPTNTRVENDAPTFNNTEQWGASLEANLELGDHTLTSISAYRTWDFANNIDVDGLNNPQPLFLAPLVATFIGQFNRNGGTTDIRQLSQELRIASPTGGLFEYVAGLFYYDLDLDRSFDRRVFLCIPGGANGPLIPGQACAAPQPRSTFHNANTKTKNYAAFGQVTANLTDALSLLGGFRLQREKVSYSGNRPGTGIVPGDVGLLGASVGAASVSDTDLALKGGVQYAFARNAQAYFTYTQGYKGRGYDVEVTANFASQQPVRPETVDAFELGFKGATSDGRFSANIALFHQKYDDLQVQATTQVNGLNQFVQTNAGSSTSKGVEVEFAARPSDRLTLSGGITYLEADINTTGTNCNLTQAAVVIAPTAAQPFNTCFRFTGEAAGLNRQNIDDGRLPNAPRYRLNLTGRYEAPVSGTLEAFVQSSVNMQSDVLFSLEQDPLTAQDGYVTVDASIGVKDVGNRYQLTLFVRNLFDEQYATSMFRDAFFGNAASPNNIDHYLPKEANRYFGASVRVSF
jgi:iron complex outermembrane receptor protein